MIASDLSKPAFQKRFVVPLSFWVWAVAGVAATGASWFWFGISMQEEIQDQCKNLSAATSMEGFGAAFGIPPLALMHLVGLGILTWVLVRANAGRHWVAVLIAGLVVAIVSVPGLVVMQLVYNGELFTMASGPIECLA